LFLPNCLHFTHTQNNRSLGAGAGGRITLPRV
jgi:hypothetical protein